MLSLKILISATILAVSSILGSNAIALYNDTQATANVTSAEHATVSAGAMIK